MKIKKRLFQNPIFWAFLLSFTYWFYLVLTSHMEISCDAIGYENLGKLLAEQGWIKFFKAGLQREPVYLGLIAFSMGLEKISGISYQLIQMAIQLLILFLTQILALRILRILKINDLLSALTILYLGISPAMVNSALSLFSEIIIYPFMLAIVLLMYQAWISFSGPKIRIVVLAIATGLTLSLMTLSRGIFEFIAPVFIGMFFLSTLFTRKRRFIFNAVVYFVITLIIFYVFITGYKLTNLVLNGHFMVTDRGAHMLYGSAARRAEPLTRERFLTALAYIPGEGICNVIFGKEKCFFWSGEKLDEFAYTKAGELQASGLRPEEVDKETFRAALKIILQKPGQFVLFWFEDGLKMFFWESTQIGFVSYSAGLTKLFCWAPIKNGLRLLMAILTFVAFIYLISFLLRERKNFFVPHEKIKIILFLSLLLIFLFSSAQALFIIVGRYALPVVPLYLIILAFFIQKIVTKAKQA
ncbi:MAG: hypothetical protein Q7K98_04135 [Candidatus Omnitrophota bacterium]|nr:hypothetical protein [Candidatus Omnitrophota bacterium]